MRLHAIEMRYRNGQASQVTEFVRSPNFQSKLIMLRSVVRRLNVRPVHSACSGQASCLPAWSGAPSARYASGSARLSGVYIL